MAEGRTFQAKIELMGKLHASLSGAVKMAQNQLNRLGAAARRMGAMVGRGFAKLGSIVTSFAGQLIGLTLAFAGLQSAAAFIGKSKEQFRENEQAAAALNATLANNPAILKLGEKEVAKQQKMFSDLADRMQESSAYASSTWRAAFTGLAQWGAGAKDAEKLSGFINDILAGRHGLKATAGDAKALGDQLGKLVKTGKLGKLGKEFGLGKDDEKRMARMKTAAERIAYIQSRATKYRGRAEALGTTEAYKIQQAENRIADFQSRMGEGFVRVEGKWIRFVDRMLPTLEPAIKTMTELFEDMFDVAADAIEKLVFDPEVQKAWNDLAKAAGELWGVISELLGIKDLGFSQWIKQEVIGFFNDLKATVDTIKGVLQWFKDFKFPDWKLPEFAMPEFKLPEFKPLETNIEGLKTALAGIVFPALVLPDFSTVETAINKVKSAVENVAKAFGAWDIPGALKAGLDWVVTKAGEAAAALSGAGKSARFEGGGGGGSSGTTGGWQHGGIVSRPTFGMVGEAGPEAVIPLGGGQRSRDLLGTAAAALGMRGGHQINYAPNFTINGGGPEIAHAVERIVRAGNDELVRQIEAIDSEMMRRAFV